jgi:hypothetical protein
MLSRFYRGENSLLDVLKHDFNVQCYLHLIRLMYILATIGLLTYVKIYFKNKITQLNTISLSSITCTKDILD